MKNQNQDIVGEKCVKDDAGDLAFDNESKLAAWKSHYEKLLNVEFPWDSNILSDEPPTKRSSNNYTNDKNDQIDTLKNEKRKSCRAIRH